MTYPGQARGPTGGQGPLSCLPTHFTAAFAAFPKVCSTEPWPCKMSHSRGVPWSNQFGENSRENDPNLWLIPKDGVLQGGEKETAEQEGLPELNLDNETASAPRSLLPHASLPSFQVPTSGMHPFAEVTLDSPFLECPTSNLS